MVNIAATKSNLIKSKEKLNFLTEGYDILDKKRKVLLQTYREKLNERNAYAKEVNEILTDLRIKLNRLKIYMGQQQLLEVSQSINEDDSIEINEQIYMQSKLPKISFDTGKLSLSYSFNNTPIIFDEIVISVKDIKKAIFKLSELDSVVYFLNSQLKKTEKKVNSLEKVQIPKFQNIVKDISSQIEEKEREEFSKAKIVKNKTQQKNQKDH